MYLYIHFRFRWVNAWCCLKPKQTARWSFNNFSLTVAVWRLERKRCRFFLHFNATALETWPKQILLSRINFCQQWMIRYRSLQQLLIFTFPQMYVIVWFVVVRMYQCTSFFLLHYKMANHEFQVNIQPKVQFSWMRSF